MVQERDAICMTYEVIEDRYFYAGLGRVSYGIAAYADDMTDEIVAVDAVHDMTADKDKIQAFVGRCNRCGLSLSHLVDVIEDFFAE